MNMVPNNNFSVLPWYRSLEEQNARKWWAYGKVYPLFTPADFILPFQVIRDTLRVPIYGDDKGEVIESTSILAGRVMRISSGGTGEIISQLPASNRIAEYNVEGLPKVWLDNIPLVLPAVGEPCNVAFFDANGDGITGHDMDDGTGGILSTSLVVPPGATTLYVSIGPTSYPEGAKVSAPEIVGYQTAPISLFEIYKADGTLVGDYSGQVNPVIKSFDDYEVVIYQGLLPFVNSFENGQYYAKMSDAVNTWYSEVFTVVNDTQPYVKIEWWDKDDFVMNAGTIVYKNPSFRNVLYLITDIAKPEYPFEEEGENRDGYFFPIKQISKKQYHFRFLASEYLLDVMRFIRMSDYVRITYRGQVYYPDTFLITPEWEGNGDIANVEAEFDTATVAKKIGMGYIKTQRGDFNYDFNDDFNN